MIMAKAIPKLNSPGVQSIELDSDQQGDNAPSLGNSCVMLREASSLRPFARVPLNEWRLDHLFQKVQLMGKAQSVALSSLGITSIEVDFTKQCTTPKILLFSCIIFSFGFTFKSLYLNDLSLFLCCFIFFPSNPHPV